MKKLILILSITIVGISFSQEIKTQYEQIYLQNSDTCIGYYAVQPYPNPFGYVTYLRFGIPDSSKISILVKNINGNDVYNQEDIILKSGNYYFDYGEIYKNEMSGVFFIKISATTVKLFREMDFNAILKVIIVK